MAIIVVESHCPACQQAKWGLAFWRMIGEVHLYVCDECKERTFSEDELLRIGFLRGYEFAKESVRDAIGETAPPKDLGGGAVGEPASSEEKGANDPSSETAEEKP